jgi:hypothetical protein
MTMRNLAMLVLCCGVVVACGGGPTAPTALELAPSPAAIVPAEVFPLPPGAPLNAAAPPHTSRVTITTIEIAVAEKPGGLPGRTLVEYTFGMWMFVPRGLEGPYDIDMRVDNSGRGQGWIGIMVDAGYTRMDFHTTAVSVPLNFVVARHFVTLATMRIVLPLN